MWSSDESVTQLSRERGPSGVGVITCNRQIYGKAQYNVHQLHYCIHIKIIVIIKKKKEVLGLTGILIMPKKYFKIECACTFLILKKKNLRHLATFYQRPSPKKNF